MSYDEKTDKIDWKDEYSWIIISAISGIVLSFIFIIFNRFFFGDKIYNDADFFEQINKRKNSYMLTPVKTIKNQPDILKHIDKAANDLFSTAVSRIRQPIESLFNWLIVKTDIQRASKVRSTNGLLAHVFGCIAAAFIFLIFNS